MAYIQRIAYRHLYSIRFQMVATLGMIFESMLKFDFEEWLKESAPMVIAGYKLCDYGDRLSVRHDEDGRSKIRNYAVLLSSSLLSYESLASEGDADMKSYFMDSLRSTSASDHADEDYHGTDLGGSWDLEAFVVRGGIILTLGALEEFERGMLRILFNYGKKPTAGRKRKIFYPRLRHYTELSDEWVAQENSRKIYSVNGRHKLLESYSINADPDVDWCRRLRSMRTDRNTIAHGIAALDHPFQAFLQLHYDTYRCVRHLSTEALGAQRIAL